MVVNDERPISLTNYFVDGEPGAAIKSTTTSGRVNTPPQEPTANGFPAMSMPKPEKNAKKNWQ